MPGIDDIGRIREALDGIRSNIATKTGVVRYVDANNGNDNYDALSREHPVHSINTAIGLSAAGDTIHIARGTYDEAVLVNVNALQVICEPGVYIINSTPGTAVQVTGQQVYWEGGVIEINGQIGMDVDGTWFVGKNIQAYNCSVGFDMNSDFPVMINCRANEIATAGFNITENSGFYIDCLVDGVAASRGFYLSNTNAEHNVFVRCTTNNCTTAGYETVAGADENIFDHCSQSKLCDGPVDAGTDNTWNIHSYGADSTPSTKIRTTWFVDSTNGSDNYSGRSRTSAFATIGAAVSAAAAGDRIRISRDTYDEAVSIPAGLVGLEIICEPGATLTNSTPGTVVAIAADAVRWKGGLISQTGQTGMEINGGWFLGEDIRAYICTIGFDMNGAHPVMVNCRTNQTTSSGFDISEDSGFYIHCDVHGDAASRGFYLSHTNAHYNILRRCSTLGCTAGGYECVAGADENVFDCCSQSVLCAGPTDAGASNTWASHNTDSQITAGYTLQEDLKAIYDEVDTLETGQGRILCSLDFWSTPQEEVAVTNVAGDKSLPDVTVAGLPSGATIVRAICMFKFRMIEETSSGVNKLDGAQEIQVRDDTPGSWADCINFVDDQFTLAADAREGGDVVMGAIDVSGTVDGNDTYNFQWDEAVADADGINFNDVQVGIRIWFSI